MEMLFLKVSWGENIEKVYKMNLDEVLKLFYF